MNGNYARNDLDADFDFAKVEESLSSGKNAERKEHVENKLNMDKQQTSEEDGFELVKKKNKKQKGMDKHVNEKRIEENGQNVRRVLKTNGNENRENVNDINNKQDDNTEATGGKQTKEVTDTENTKRIYPKNHTQSRNDREYKKRNDGDVRNRSHRGAERFKTHKNNKGID